MSITLEELMKEKEKLQDSINRAVERYLKNFYKKTGVTLNSVTIGLVKGTSDIKYILCELDLN